MSLTDRHSSGSEHGVIVLMAMIFVPLSNALSGHRAGARALVPPIASPSFGV